MIRLSNDDVKISGSTMTGSLFLNTNSPTVNEQSASKKYVDDQAGGGPTLTANKLLRSDPTGAVAIISGWNVDQTSAGHLELNTNNVTDIGTSSVGLRSLYAATALVSPKAGSDSGSFTIKSAGTDRVEFRTDGHLFTVAAMHNTIDIGNDNDRDFRNVYAATLLKAPTVRGNTHDGVGAITIKSGGSNHITMNTNSTSRWEFRNDGHLLPSADAVYDLGSAGGREIREVLAVTVTASTEMNSPLYTANAGAVTVRAPGGSLTLGSNGTDRVEFRSDGHLFTTAAMHNTIDIGNDNDRDFRNVNAGTLLRAPKVITQHLFANSTISGGSLLLESNGSDIIFKTNGTERWEVDSATGNFNPRTGGTYDIGTSSLHVQNIFTEEVSRSDGGDLTVDANTGSILWSWGNLGNRLRATSNCFEPIDDLGLNLGFVGNVWNGLSVGNIEGHSVSGLTLSMISGTSLVIRGNSVSVPSPQFLLQVSNSGILQPFDDGLKDIGTSSTHFGTFYIDTIQYAPAASGYATHTATEATSGTLTFNADDSNTTTVDITNGCSGVAQLKVNGTVVNVPFTGKHIYNSGDSNLQPGDPVKLVNGQLQACGDADVACIGVMTGEVLTTVASGNYIYDSYNNYYDHDELNPKVLQHVASHGDSYCEGLEGITVTDETGSINAGDRLCTTSNGKFRKWVSGTDAEFSKKLWVPEDVEFTNGEATNIYAYFVNQ